MENRPLPLIIKIKIYYQPYTDSDEHWVCHFGPKESDFSVGKTPVQSFQRACRKIKKIISQRLTPKQTQA